MGRPEQFGPVHPDWETAVTYGSEYEAGLAFGFEAVEFEDGWQCQIAVPEGEELVALLLSYREAIRALRSCTTALELLHTMGSACFAPGLPALRESVGKCLAEYREDW